MDQENYLSSEKSDQNFTMMTKSPRENDVKFKRKSLKGKVESADVKR